MPPVPSGFITLLTDFGLEDAYVGVMKGVIAKINPRVNVIDLCHHVAPQNIKEAAFLLNSSYAFFPPGTIHLTVVDPTVGGKRRALCIAAGNYYFIGPDNGVLSIACAGAGISSIYSLQNDKYFLEPRSRTFHGRDVFAPAAAHLSSGVPLQLMGRRLRTMKQIKFPLPAVEQGRRVTGRVLYKDRFGNLISDIDERTLTGAFIGIDTKQLIVKCAGIEIVGLSDTYCDVAPGEALAVFGSYNLLELAVREGSAAERTGVGEGAEIRVERPRIPH
jgi:hypothetical protein